MIASHQLMQTAVVADANSLNGGPIVVIETLQPCSYQQRLLLLSYMEAAMCLGAYAAGGVVVGWWYCGIQLMWEMFIPSGQAAEAAGQGGFCW